MADPYQVLGVRRDASDGEVRAAYRRLVQRYHPDHNAGSVDSARRFEEVQDAYSRIRELRAKAPPRRQAPPASGARARAPRAGPAPPTTPTDPAIESRLADLERAVREAHEAREGARRAAREAAAKATERERPSDEELGYVTTDDSFTKIFDDALSQLSHKLAGARETPIGKRVEDLIEDLDFLHSHGDDKRQ